LNFVVGVNILLYLVLLANHILPAFFLQPHEQDVILPLYLKIISFTFAIQFINQFHTLGAVFPLLEVLGFEIAAVGSSSFYAYKLHQLFLVRLSLKLAPVVVAMRNKVNHGDVHLLSKPIC
jgi:hypothetical protein